MKNPSLIAVYGSYGYTGQLIVRLCKSKGLQVILAGRDELKLKQQSTETGYPYRVLGISDKEGLQKWLEPAEVLIHCGGPFRYTAGVMAEICLRTKTHYTDITGEYEVFELLAGKDSEAKQSGIMIMPGTGFDVVPSDCLALHLKNRLPGATHLQLAFTSTKGGLSRGTRKSMTEGLGYGGLIRTNGKLTMLPLGDKVMEVNFGPFKVPTMCIPWGDISTAWRSTGIPNIEVYTGVTESMIRNAKRSRYINWLLRLRPVKNFLLNQIDKKAPGPSEETRNTSKSYLWGKVTDAKGTTAESRLETLNGYNLTAITAVIIAEKILSGDFKMGYQTPAMAYGENLILEVPETRRTDL
ncbi:MAG: saccharopine dehydrogenase NADP-binding domain-containing protein [Bacteroidetes bacterium]|nr:saccharopine dehydrogenase NADP-binding domain-containing protein [Bacteroidota bacterium]